MKILHFLVTTALSGAEHVVVDILDALKEENEVYYVSPDGNIRESVEERGITFIPCDTEKISEIRRVYSEIKPDIVHACDPRMSFKCALAGIPFIAHFHSNCSWMRKLCPNSVALLFTAWRSEAVIAVSDIIEKEYVFSRFIKRKLHVIENAVKRDFVLARSSEEYPEKYDLIYVGRFSEEKGPIEFLEIARKVQKSIPNIKCAMVGEGEMTDDALEYIKKNSQKSVSLLGFQPNPYKIMANSKIIVMPSKVEGFGLVAVEGMILSKPIIAYKVGALPEIVGEDAGFLCDNSDGAAECAVELLTNGELYGEKSSGALRKSYKFTDSEKYIEKIKALYGKVASRRIGD